MKKYNASKDEIKRVLIDYYTKTGKVPKITLKSPELGISPAVVRGMFGTWNQAIEYSGLTPRVRNERVSTKCATCYASIELIPSQIREHNFCNASCAATHNNKSRTHSDDTKQKISHSVKKSLADNPRPPRPPRPLLCRWPRKDPSDPVTHINTCLMCKTHFGTTNKTKKYCDKPCRIRAASKRQSEFLRKNRAHIRGPHKQSYMESTFEKWLTTHGIFRGLSGYLPEVYFYNKNSNKNGWADFVFPRKRLIIELDGSHHKNRKELDRIRDAHLKQ